MEDNSSLRDDIILLYLGVIVVSCAVLAIMYIELSDISYLKMAFRVFIIAMLPFCIIIPFALNNVYGEDCSDKNKAGKPYTKWEEFGVCVLLTVLAFIFTVIFSGVGYALYNLFYWVFT